MIKLLLTTTVAVVPMAAFTQESAPIYLAFRPDGADLTTEGQRHTSKFTLVRVESVGKSPAVAFLIQESECPQWIWNAVKPSLPTENRVQSPDLGVRLNYPSGDFFPINNVDASYVNHFLDAMQKWVPGVRLPTVSEWRTAVNATGSDARRNEESRLVGLTLKDQPMPKEIKQFKSGVLYDIFSNVEEMCFPDPEHAPSWPKEYARLGGSWLSPAADIGMKFEIYSSGKMFSRLLGFRLVIPWPEQTNVNKPQ